MNNDENMLCCACVMLISFLFSFSSWRTREFSECYEMFRDVWWALLVGISFLCFLFGGMFMIKSSNLLGLVLLKEHGMPCVKEIYIS